MKDIFKIDTFPLTFPVPIPDEEKKSSEIFLFTLLYGASKGFMKALKALIISIQLSEMHGPRRVK